MAKKVTNPKLLAKSAIARPQIKPAGSVHPPKRVSAFQQHANQIQQRRKKKQQRKNDAVSRLVKENKVNRVADLRMKTNNKKMRFDLDDDERNMHAKLTHRGKAVDQIDEFNEMVSASEDSAMNEEFVEKTHFAGFEDNNDQMEQQQNAKSKLPKTKKQVYEQIMAKSKLYKQAKQQQLQDNFEKAVELDKELPALIPQLKFRGEKALHVEGQDNDFLEMMEELKGETMVQSQKPVTVQQEKRQATKRKLKKQEYLRQLEKEGEQDDVDVRGFVRGIVEEGSDEDSEEVDQMDEVDLSSGNDDSEDDEMDSGEGQESDGDQQEDQEDEQDQQEDEQGQQQEENSED